MNVPNTENWSIKLLSSIECTVTMLLLFFHINIPHPNHFYRTCHSKESKILANATVRLYRLNPSTMGYEAHAGGAAFGCVVLGSGDKYQILVYDGQKVPQLVTPLRAGFTYNLRDLYVSLTDSNGVNWSILFDSVESLYLVGFDRDRDSDEI